MKIKSIKLSNFKRFSDLHIKSIPEKSKLVLIIGPNGCGKSSLFDAFLQWYRIGVGFGPVSDISYFRKYEELNWNQSKSVQISIHSDEKPIKGCLYIRTAYRNDPNFKISSIARVNSPIDSVKIDNFMQNDKTVSENYARLVYDTTTAVYSETNDEKFVRDLRKELIGRIQESMINVFEDLILKNIADPLGEGTFFFEKGSSKYYEYKNLSGGEKAAFDILLDLHIKEKYHNNSIFCIDEPETHIHTKAQGKLLKEMVRIVPDSAQLWITTHSLGILRAAQEIEKKSPGTVCVIDFDNVEADQPTILTPSSIGKASWEKMLSVTLDDLSPQIAPKYIVVCEGSSIGNRRKNFDADIYNKIFNQNYYEITFVSGGSGNEIQKTSINLISCLGAILNNTKIIPLRDRDDMSDTEVSEFEKSGGVVLDKRNIESYMFTDDILNSLSDNNDPLYQEFVEIRKSAINNSIQRGNPNDDLKSAAGEIVNGLKRVGSFIHSGNSTDAFIRDTIVPHISSDTPTYTMLKKSIIDKIVNNS